MKKLIAMIGAVAMAFGLYAEGTPADNYYSTSFEAADEGVNDTDKTWDAGEAGWTTTQTEAFTLGVQDPPSALPYADGRARRDDLFEGKAKNDNFLKLETGTNTLSHTIGTAQVYFDQLVKFTGYEEDPVIADDAKIAVWMSAIESDTTVEPAIDGATNLYVTVGTGTGTTKVQVAGDFKVDQWYRVTIKSIDNVSTVERNSQLGFQLFINGAAASIVEGDDRSYNENSDSFNATAAALYGKGQLFTAIAMNDLTLATVAYQGIGGVDDIIFSQEAPDFDQFVEFTVGEVTGVELVKVEGPDGVLTVPYAVMPGSQVKIYVKAADGYRIDNLPAGYITKTISQAGAVDISGDLAGKVVKGAVQVVNAATPTVTNVYAEAELGTVLTGLKTGDTATVLENCAIQDKDENTLFSFTANTTVAVPEANVWNVFIAKWVFDNKGTLEDKAGELTDNVGLFAGKTVNVTFDDPVDAKHKCTLYIAGAIAGDITAGAKGLVVVNTDSIETTLTGTLNAVEIDVADEVTFVDSGKIVSATDLTEFEDNFLPEGEVEITENAGIYTAQIKQETGFAITIGTLANVTLTIDGNPATNFTANADQEYTLAVAAAEGYNTPVITFEGEPIPAGAYNAYKFTAAGTLAASATINTYTVTFSTNDTAVAEKTVTGVEHGATLTAAQIPDDFGEGKWDVDPAMAVITCDTNFNFTVEEPVIPVPIKPDVPLDPQGEAALEAVMLEFGTPEAIDTWAKAVYADGKIPASKLNESTSELIAIAKEYNIPVLTEDATVTTAQAADGAFTFKIVDGGDVQLLAAAVEKMIKYSADLGTFTVNTDQVDAAVQADNVTIKAEFLKPNDEAKGFMKLELTAP